MWLYVGTNLEDNDLPLLNIMEPDNRYTFILTSAYVHVIYCMTKIVDSKEN